MKKFVIGIIFLISNLFSHSQTPIEFGGEENKLDTVSMSQIKIVPITVQNLNNYEQQYYIEVDSEVIGVTQELISNQSIKLNVPVKIRKIKQLEVHKICTVSIPKQKDELFKSKICTKAYLYWIKE